MAVPRFFDPWNVEHEKQNSISSANYVIGKIKTEGMSKDTPVQQVTDDYGKKSVHTDSMENNQFSELAFK